MVPKSMVNIEIPVTPELNTEKWTSSGHVVDLGQLGPYARLGMFLPGYSSEELWRQGVIANHWRSLFLPEVKDKFSYRSKFSSLINLTMSSDSSDNTKHFCESGCDGGLYYGPSCNNQHQNCSVLFSTYPEYDADILKSLITKLDLPLIVAWIGDNFIPFISERLQKQLPVLFFDFEPNPLTATYNVTSVHLPSCVPTENQLMAACEFRWNNLEKFVWNKIQVNIPEAAHVISKLKFPPQQYQALLQAYSKTLSTEKVACDWLKDNEVTWRSWIPPDLSHKPRIFLLGMFPLSGSLWQQPGLKAAAELAVRRVNLDKAVLPKYDLQVLYIDSQCKADVAMKEFIKYVQNNHFGPIAGVLGPACSDEAEPIASLSKHFHMLTVSYGAESSSLSDRVTYPYFYRTIPHAGHHKYIYQQMFSQMGWGQVGALAERTQDFPEYHVALQDFLKQHGINMVVKRNIRAINPNTDFTQVFADLRSANARIIIADFFPSTARLVMCEAYKQRMTGHEGYVWFLPGWYEHDWWDVDYHNKQVHPQDAVPCDTGMMRYAVDGHFMLSKVFSGSIKSLVIGNLTVGRYKQLYTEQISKQGVTSSSFASFVYDAVWVYALALHSLLESDPSAVKHFHSERNTRRLVANIARTNFRGASGEMRFEGSDRPSDINLMQFFHNGTCVIGSYKPGTALKGGKLHLDVSKIKWLTSTGEAPTDGQRGSEHCVIENLRQFFGVTCEMAIIIANIIGFAFLIVLVLVVIVFIKYRYDVKMRSTHDRMKELGLLPNDFAKCFTLDEWEMPRDKVVLNRKLGEGAFGTVYGGEAYQDNELWVAVAVKTLKIGSRVEEKIDFLSEAEIMKRFHHPNIVQLLGVCTRGEPFMAIMEFHLYGDLKTYLLSRRNLVGLECKEADEIRPERLTMMALDISCGLRYIHDLKYVHRDLACRNCLIHSSGRVKIGDFGMTRPIIESDYYRFTKKGMLPVRWMSPESLSDGLFTAKSDMWSYGVLLYEIVTFGSFPYQGLSNSQVVEFVRSGSRLMLPRQCSEDLCTFIYSCLAYEPCDRPNTCEVIDQLLKHPDFLLPCLDAPTTSVEDTEDTELLTSSQHNTITKSHSLNLTTLLNRLSTASNDGKRLSGASQGGKTPSKYTIKTFVPAILGRPRSNSISSPQPSQKNHEYFEIHDESPSNTLVKSHRHSLELQRELIQMEPSISLGDTYPTAGERTDTTSDYFSDNSKEIVQNLTFEFCQTITSL
ncbi:atrial natriuretic peptide receptor 2-like isoform X2 [Ostrea edulis]|nr:atrial natriuretic peptide receptor 2-like isoform X2 [Ostrea edulis]XP_048752691.2 atrial natriuretic peptide receptor 2-like isoform X2 [Ostrea edulis]